MKAPYYDKATNSVFLRGALNLINPDTSEYWVNEQEALAFIAALPAEVEPLIPGIKITSVSGTGADYSGGVIYTDAGVPLTVDIEIQNQGVAIEGLNKAFRVPVDRDGQQGVKVLKLEVLDGVGRFVTKFDSGEFFINEQTINRRLSGEEFIAMDKPLHIVVAEAPEVAEVTAEATASEEISAQVEATAPAEVNVEPTPEVAEVKAEVIAPETMPAQEEAVAPVEVSVPTEAVTTEEVAVTTESAVAPAPATSEAVAVSEETSAPAEVTAVETASPQ